MFMQEQREKTAAAEMVEAAAKWAEGEEAWRQQQEVRGKILCFVYTCRRLIGLSALCSLTAGGGGVATVAADRVGG